MSYDSTRISLYTVLQAGIDSEIPIRFDTILEDDPVTLGNNPWVRCSIEPFEKMQVSIGLSHPIDRTLGFLIVEIYDREQNGYAEILRIADTVSSLYMGKTFSGGSVVVNKLTIISRETYNGWNSKVVQIGYVENTPRI